MLKKFLIVNADDFGLSPGISNGILSAMRNGVVSSTSVIVKSPYLDKTVKVVANNLDLDWGLHVVLKTQGGQMSEKYLIEESSRQVAIFRKNFGVNPTHIDYHGGFRFSARLYFAARMFAQSHKLGFRYDNHHRLVTTFYGMKNYLPARDCVDIRSLIEIFGSLGEGVTELICHPGWTSNRLADPYRMERRLEYKALVDAKVFEVLKDNKITLISYRDYVNKGR